MHKLYKSAALVFTSVLMIFSSCKEKEEVTPFTQAERKACLLTRVKNGQTAASAVLGQEYFYNQDRQIVRLNSYDLSTGGLYEYTTYRYNSAKKIIEEKCTRADSTIVYSYTYEYTPQGQLSKETFYNPVTGDTLRSDLEFNSANQLIKKHLYKAGKSGQPYAYTAFTYTPEGNVSRTQYFGLDSASATYLPGVKYEYAYDTKISPYYLIGRAPTTARNISKNNITVGSYMGPDGNVIYSASSIYVYNSENYPIQSSFAGTNGVYLMEYDCR